MQEEELLTRAEGAGAGAAGDAAGVSLSRPLIET